MRNRLGIAAVLSHRYDGSLGVSNLLLEEDPVMGNPCPKAGLLRKEEQQRE
jgi:hypothetical protein